MNLSPGPKEKLYIQKFYLYMNLTKPSELLYLSWAKVSGEGKALRPAYLVQDLMRLFPVLVPVEEDRKGGSETHSAIAQRLQQAMHQRFAQSSAVFRTRTIDLRSMVHLAEPKD